MKKQAIIGSLLLLALTACGGGGTTDNADGPLPETDKVVIGVTGGAWEENIISAGIKGFEEETGIEVDVVAGTDAEWFSKLRASNGNNPAYDVLVLQPDTITRAAATGLLQPLTEENVPNLADLYPSVQEKLQYEGETYAAGFSMGQLGIAYRKDLVDKAPESWKDLQDPAYAGHVAVSSPSYAAGLQFFSGWVNAFGGEESDQASIDKAFEELGKLSSNVVAYPDNAGSIQTLLERGDAWLVPFWDGRTFALQEAGLDLGFVYPEEGPVAAVASWVVTKGAPNEANAYKLVDYLSSPDVQKAFSDLTYYGMTNQNVEYSDSIADKVQVGEEFYRELKWVDYETASPNVADWTNRWTQVMGGGQ
ncbi:ABC transporter substrate-binding protein [Aureibacillus halotolerans]|uniref:Putative spermidine/putrescine transport system substrate-binding protein n=1 Tax=Aureibacillus halotolerans TaxID=1508390 RepID=A0A4R6UAN9_9BACI|nr:ABC transporter substrate-binding protein [Aureibacillus halotolerans]TDQ42926.1 putative spermidine/putrescine transport system substrate-binding protein [Aureibacillus halotolerans]